MIPFSKYAKIQQEKKLPEVTLQGLGSKSHIVTLSYESKRYKLFRIDFQKDGSIFVNFPYYRDVGGIASIVHMPPTDKPTYESLSITDDARITSHLVKYAHHTSGETHFSLDGHVKTEVRKQSVPLNNLQGHLFTVFVQGFEGFDLAESKKYNHGWTEDRCTVHFDFSSNYKGAIRFVATWEPSSVFIKNLKAPVGITQVGPQVGFNDPKDPGYGFVLSPDTTNPFHDHILFLRAHAMKILDKDRDSMLGLIGGFDQKSNVLNLSQESTFLSLIYPAASKEALNKIIPSMDLEK